MSDDQPLGSSLVISGLQAALKLPIADRLVIAKKAIVGIESQKLKLTHRLAEEIRRIVKSVLKSKTATQEQQDAAEDLKARLFSRSPRRKKNQGTERVLDDGSRAERPVPSVKSEAKWEFSGTWKDELDRLRSIELKCLGARVDSERFICEALGERPVTWENVKCLYDFWRHTTEHGGRRSVGNALYEKRNKLLSAAGVVLSEEKSGVIFESFEEIMESHPVGWARPEFRNPYAEYDEEGKPKN